MSMTDPIADMLTRMRNINRIGQTKVDIPKSKVKLDIARTLKREGFIEDVKEVEAKLVSDPDPEFRFHSGKPI